MGAVLSRGPPSTRKPTPAGPDRPAGSPAAPDPPGEPGHTTRATSRPASKDPVTTATGTETASERGHPEATLRAWKERR